MPIPKKCLQERANLIRLSIDLSLGWFLFWQATTFNLLQMFMPHRRRKPFFARVKEMSEVRFARANREM
jgi:hypothetical protein